jgi:hypothetical protein
MREADSRRRRYFNMKKTLRCLSRKYAKKLPRREILPGS